MREIKFRAYHDEMMWKVWKIEWHNGAIIAVSLSDTPSNQFWFADVDKPIELMQYTGLKDKNGADIYESDILRCEAENYQGIVWFGACSFLTDCEGFGDHPLGETNANDLEVIGNIHENPELLKDK